MKVLRALLWSFVYLDGLIAGLLVLVYCWWTISFSSLHLLHNSPKSLPTTEAALVLGTSQWRADGSTNLFFKYRIQAAARLYHAGKVKWLVVSGDNHVRTYDEPAMMRKALIQKGVPACRILCDYAGFRTFDSVVRMKNVFGFKRYVVVSQKFHNQRAIYLAHTFGHTVYGLNARDVMDAGGIKVHIREAGARVKAWLDVNILGTEAHFPGPRQKIGNPCDSLSN